MLCESEDETSYRVPGRASTRTFQPLAAECWNYNTLARYGTVNLGCELWLKLYFRPRLPVRGAEHGSDSTDGSTHPRSRPRYLQELAKQARPLEPHPTRDTSVAGLR